MKRLLICSSLLLAIAAHAKLPAPVLTDQAKAAAEEAKAKTAWTGKMDGYKLCLSMDRVAGHYFKTANTSGKTVKPASAGAPACVDPGPFKYVAATAGAPAAPAGAKPVEVAAASTPSKAASSPAAGKAPAAAAPAKAK
jgi:hypothetical protein